MAGSIGRIRRLSIVGAALALAVTAAGCSTNVPGSGPSAGSGSGSGGSATPKPGGTLVWGMESEADTLDAHASGGWVTWRVRRQMYEGLVTNDLTKDGTVTLPLIPQLAKSWDLSSDGLTYTFKLRQGVKFQDGTPLDAEAVKFNWERFWKQDAPHFEPLYRSGKIQLTMFLEGIETPDPMTVKFVLKQPFSAFLTLMAGSQSPFIASPTSIKKWGKDVGEHPVGTGPFKFVERQRGQKIVLEADPEYWGPKPYLKRLIYRPLPEAASRVAALRTGEADLIIVPPPDSIEQLKDAGFVINQGPTAHIWYWNFITRNTPFDNPKVRQAIAHAVDRDGIARELMRGTVTPAHHMIPPGAPSFDPDYQPYKYDPAKAKQLLAEAGYANGFSTIFATSVDGSGQLLPVPITEWIQRDLKAVGVNMKIETYEWQTYLGKGTGPQAWGHRKDLGAFQSSFGAPYDYWLQQVTHSRWITDTTPRGWYKNPEADKLFDQALIEQDEAKRIALYRQANKLIMADASYLPIVSDLAPIAYHRKVKGFAHTSEESFDLTPVWIDE